MYDLHVKFSATTRKIMQALSTLRVQSTDQKVARTPRSTSSEVRQ